MVTILSVVLGVMLMIGGASCLLLPDLPFLTLGYVIGVVMILEGLGMMIAWFQRDRRNEGSGFVLASSIISLLLGIALVGNGFLQLAVDDFIVYSAIAWLFIDGILRIVLAIKTKSLYDREKGAGRNTELGRNWWIALILGILMIISAIICLCNPDAMAHTIGVMIGIGIIISGMDLIHFGTTAWLLDR